MYFDIATLQDVPRRLVRVNLENEALNFRESMAEIDRLSERIAWIDLSFVERGRTPQWVIEVETRYHLADMSLREIDNHL